MLVGMAIKLKGFGLLFKCKRSIARTSSNSYTNRCRSSSYSTSFAINNSKVSNNISSNKNNRRNFNMFNNSDLAYIKVVLLNLFHITLKIIIFAM